MKNLFLLLATVLSFTFSFSSCTNDDDSSDDNSPINTSQLTGNWKITLFSEDGDDETYYFTNNVFVFNSNGTVTTTHNGSTINGTWTTGTDDSQSKFILNFGTTTPFDELNDDWHVLSQTATKIELEDVSGGNGGTDILHFTKQ
ncbi:MAG: hypothetical protein JNM36_02070 [Chitinophagales bacterium]|jgi:hypothetical protein|nr:hypothetical protein [Chitinophagales bacterium]HNL06471.1 hypothetical protein [Chitinophagales bacterium]